MSSMIKLLFRIAPLCLLPMLTCGYVHAAEPSHHPFALLSPESVARIPSLRGTDQAKAIIAEANALLDKAPSPMARVHTEGTLPHQGIRDQSIAAEEDFTTMAAFGFAYRLTGERRYLDAEARHLGAWAAIYRTSLNPIDETRFDPVFVAFDLTRGDLPSKVESDTLEMFRGMAAGYLDWWAANAHRDNANWSSHRIKLMTLGAYETGDSGLIDGATKAFRQQVQQNILPDGQVVDYAKRDALHYVVYDLEPLVTAALAAKMHGQDWFHTAATGSPSVQMGVDWLLPYASGEKTHEEFVHSSVRFDAARAKAGESGYSGMWQRKNSASLLTLVAWEDSHYEKFAREVQRATDGRTAVYWQLCVLSTTASQK